MRTEQIPIKEIKIGAGRLKPDEKVVKQLMESIPKQGLLNPITVCRIDNVVRLVAGGNRLEAHKRLKLPTIMACVEKDATPEWRELAEIDENLIRRDLSLAYKAKITARRKDIYEALKPSAPKAGRIGGDNRSPKAVFGDKAFTADTAKKTGRSQGGIAQDLQIAAAIGDEGLDKIKGTSLDKNRELIALARMKDKSARDKLIVRAAKGEKVSAVKPAADCDDACSYDWKNPKAGDFGDPGEMYIKQADQYRREATTLAEGYPLLSKKAAELITDAEINAAQAVVDAWRGLVTKLKALQA